MAHKRTELRAALVGLLTGTGPAYATSVDDKVYTNRIHNTAKEKLPAIFIHDADESASLTTLPGRRYQRTWTVRIEAIIEASQTGYDTTLDALVSEIETLLHNNPTLDVAGVPNGLTYTGTEIVYEPANKTIGSATLTYEIKYLA